MLSILKATSLDNLFPLLAVENGCIVSKEADITVGFKVTLPELYTVTSAEYEVIHSTWVKALKVLPNFTVVHKQDWFLKESYEPQVSGDNSFLSNAFERHFNERPYLHHTCYLFITKTTKERSRMQSNLSTLCRGSIMPKSVKDREQIAKFLETVSQAESIINDSGLLRVERLSTDDIIGTEERAGIVEKYFALSQSDTTTLKDLTINPNEMRIEIGRAHV